MISMLHRKQTSTLVTQCARACEPPATHTMQILRCPAGLQRSVQLQCRHANQSLRGHVRTSASVALAPAAAAAPDTAELQERFRVVDLKQQTAEIRQRVCRDFLAGGVIYLSAGDLKLRNGVDVFHKFRPDSNFAYLTGVHDPGFACLLDTSSATFTLLAPRVPPEAAVWWGGLPSLEECAAAAGADRCIYIEDLPAHLKQHHSGQVLHVMEAAPAHAPPTSTQPADPHAPAPLPTPTALAAMAAAAGMQQVNASMLPTFMQRSRSRKTDAEVGCLLHANQVSGAAHQAVWRSTSPGLTEYQLEAEFVRATMAGGCLQLGYPCIVGAGPNAGVLHYERNAATLQQQDLVLIDAGAEFRCYTADITRTFPAAGRFSAAQRDVYEAVLATQLHALDLIKPDALWKDIDAAARHVLLDHLIQMGLVKGSVDQLMKAKVDRVFMPHGLGHHLGLDVHDMAEEGPVPVKLQPGYVVTCEPGCYFMPMLIERALADKDQAPLLNEAALQPFLTMGGVRIEDNVAVTEDGAFNLTMAASVPKAAADVEAVMALPI